jgi:predicted dehydrogenase
MPQDLSRRDFVKSATVFSFGLAAAGLAPRLQAAASANSRLRVAVFGLGRGFDHVKALQPIDNVEIATICDVDSRRFERVVKSFTEKNRPVPKTEKDFRRVLDDPSIDAVFIATPNFAHAPITILACAAGKHVYVEKPGSHNPQEGEWMVAAARKHDRVVQMGNQRRSWPGVIEAIEKLRAGVIGKVTFARGFYANSRASIGHGKPVPIPAELDFDLWQGPAPERPYVDNLVHYNWHWRWHWGGGEMANNGPHALDLMRWGLDVELPKRITYNGGRYQFKDDQESPDTAQSTFDFGHCGLSWDHSSCNSRSGEALPFVAFYGENGMRLDQAGSGYRVLDGKGKLVAEGNGPGGDVSHIQNFLDAVRGQAKPHSEIAVGQTSTLLCHLANIAYRTGHTIDFDPVKRRILDDRQAAKLWRREYRKGWTPKV